jgi:hypothetical protein
MFPASSAHLQEVNDVNCTCMQPLIFSFSAGGRLVHLLSKLPVAMQSKASVCRRPFSGIPCSNSFEGMIVCLLWVLCVVTWRCLRQPDPSSRGVPPSVCVCVSLSMIRCNNNPLDRQWVGRRSQTEKERNKERTKLRSKAVASYLTHFGKEPLWEKHEYYFGYYRSPCIFKRISVAKYLSVIMRQGRKLCYYAVNDSGVWN